eukprot:8223448-Pyramimonas_sp.AAC.1
MQARVRYQPRKARCFQRFGRTHGRSRRCGSSRGHPQASLGCCSGRPTYKVSLTSECCERWKRNPGAGTRPVSCPCSLARSSYPNAQSPSGIAVSRSISPASQAKCSVSDMTHD